MNVVEIKTIYFLDTSALAKLYRLALLLIIPPA